MYIGPIWDLLKNGKIYDYTRLTVLQVIKGCREALHCLKQGALARKIAPVTTLQVQLALASRVQGSRTIRCMCIRTFPQKAAGCQDP